MAVATISFIHPWSASKGERIQSLIASSLPTSSSPPTGRTTHVYATPSTRPKAPSQQLSTQASKSGGPLVAAIVIYNSASDREAHGADSSLQTYRKAVTDESLSAQPEELKEWLPVGGFVNREKLERDAQGGKTVMLARFECKDAKGAKARVVKELSKFAAWVEKNEPKTLTYAVLARPDGQDDSNHVIMFERYTGPDAVAEHAKAKEFKAMFKAIVADIHPKATKIAEWIEGANSFAGRTSMQDIEGGGRAAKL